MKTHVLNASSGDDTVTYNAPGTGMVHIGVIGNDKREAAANLTVAEARELIGHIQAAIKSIETRETE